MTLLPNHMDFSYLVIRVLSAASTQLMAFSSFDILDSVSFHSDFLISFWLVPSLVCTVEALFYILEFLRLGPQSLAPSSLRLSIL